MKSLLLKLITILCVACLFVAYMLIMNGCHSNNYNDYQPRQYILFLGVQDADGDDLVKGVEGIKTSFTPWGPEIKSDLYTFEIIYPDPCMDVYYNHYHSGEVGFIPDDIGQHPPIQVVKLDDRYSLIFDVKTNNYECCPCPFANSLTFKLSCPYIFGDDIVHEIITYWREAVVDPYRQRIFCDRIVLDGKDYSPEIKHIRSSSEIFGFETVEGDEIVEKYESWEGIEKVKLVSTPFSVVSVTLERK